jgi:hypothetical protein
MPPDFKAPLWGNRPLEISACWIVISLFFLRLPILMV